MCTLKRKCGGDMSDDIIKLQMEYLREHVNINKLRMEYLREHVDDVKKVCDGCLLNKNCIIEACLLVMWFPKDYKCQTREFLEQNIKSTGHREKNKKGVN